MANKHIKRCTTLIIIREMQIKTIVRYHLTPARMAILKSLQTTNAGEGIEKRECSYTVGGNVTWYTHYERRYGDFLKKLGIKPPYDPAIPLQGIYPKEIKTERDTCITLFIAVLFTIARTWKQLRCPSTEMDKEAVVYIHNGILLIHKKEDIWVSFDVVDEPRT